MIWTFVLRYWKVFAIGGALLAILFAFRLWLVKHDEAIYQEGKIAGTVAMEKAKVAEWKAKEEELAKAQSDIELTRSQIDSEMTVLTRTRQMTRAELAKTLAAIRAGKEVRNETVDAVADADLDTALRSVSNQLAAAAGGKTANPRSTP